MMWLAAFGVILATRAGAETLPAPKIDQDDAWTYLHTVEDRSGWHQTHVETAVEHGGADSIAISSKPVGSTMPPSEILTGTDWSRLRSVNGRETLVNRPFAFPLSVGKTWTVEYSEDHPNRLHSSEHFRTVYKVVGWDQVTVPAGSFNAMKIEAEGEWSAVLAPSVGNMLGSRVDGQGSTIVMQSTRTVPATVSGRTYKAFWYVPSVKKWAKSVEEYYGANNVRNERYTDELESYKVTN
jgi:hypothetical protein